MSNVARLHLTSKSSALDLAGGLRVSVPQTQPQGRAEAQLGQTQETPGLSNNSSPPFLPSVQKGILSPLLLLVEGVLRSYPRLTGVVVFSPPPQEPVVVAADEDPRGKHLQVTPWLREPSPCDTLCVCLRWQLCSSLVAEDREPSSPQLCLLSPREAK